MIYENTLKCNKRITKKEAKFVTKMIEFSEYCKENGVKDMVPNNFEKFLMKVKSIITHYNNLLLLL